jgi:hypothetical protein
MRLYEKVFANLKSQFENVDVVFIVSVWRQRGGKIFGALNPQQCQRMFSREVSLVIPPTCLYDNFYLKMPNIRAAITERVEQRGTITEAMIQKYFPDAVIEIEEESVVSQVIAKISSSDAANSYRMYYKISRANDIKKELEAERGSKFDVVIRTRPDRPFSTLLIPDDIYSDDRVIYLDWFSSGAPHAGDQLAIGSSNALDRYASIFGELEKRVGDIEHAFDWKGTHSELAKHLIGQDLIVRPIPPEQVVMNEEYLNTAEFLEILRLDEDLAVPGVKAELNHFRASIEGSIMLGHGDLDNALLKSEQGIAAHPELPGAWFLKAQIQRKQGRLSDALSSAMHALRHTGWAKGEYSFIATLIFELINEVDIDEGLHAAEAHTRYPGNISFVHTTIGLLYVRKASYLDARTCFQMALEIDPTHHPALENNKKIERFLT